MPKVGRRNLLKMLGVAPVVLAPWTPATEQVAPPQPGPAAIPPLPEITTPPEQWHPLNGPPEFEPWTRAMIAAGATASTGMAFRMAPIDWSTLDGEEADDGTV